MQLGLQEEDGVPTTDRLGGRQEQTRRLRPGVRNSVRTLESRREHLGY